MIRLNKIYYSKTKQEHILVLAKCSYKLLNNFVSISINYDGWDAEFKNNDIIIVGADIDSDELIGYEYSEFMENFMFCKTVRGRKQK